MAFAAGLILIVFAATSDATYRWLDCSNKYNGICMNRRLAPGKCKLNLIPEQGICPSDLDVCCSTYSKPESKPDKPEPARKEVCELMYGNKCFRPGTTDRTCLIEATSTWCHNLSYKCCKKWEDQPKPETMCEQIYKGTCVDPQKPKPGEQQCGEFVGSSRYTCDVVGQQCCRYFKKPRPEPTAEDLKCGVPTKPVGALGWRIVHGQNASHGAWPWQVSLRVYDEHFCGASIINDRWLLSASHCFRTWPAFAIRAVVGAHKLHEEADSQDAHEVTHIVMHKLYNPNSKSSPHDIALIHLKTPIRFSPHVRRVCLPDQEVGHFDGYADCHISGWGRTQGTADRRHLQQLTHESLTQKECKNRWADYLIEPGHICIGRGQSGACLGDSGGPMVCREGGVFYQVGVTSWGSKDCYGKGYPSVYTRVNHYKEWIEGVQEKFKLLEERNLLDGLKSTTIA